MYQTRTDGAQSEYDALAIGRMIVDVASDIKASDIVLMEIGKLTAVADFFVIATANSDRQIRAVATAIRERMKTVGVHLFQQEGEPSDGWVLLDYGQVVVHVFADEQRMYYDLERHWGSASVLLRIQ